MRSEQDIAAEMALAEAVAWLTTLHGRTRSAAEEAAFQQWLAADPAHARAFAQVTELWDVLPGAVEPAELRPAAPAPRAVTAPGRPRWRAHALAACTALLLAATAGVVQLTRDPVYETEVGEQRALALEDGTRVALNTASRMRVDYDEAERRVYLAQGEVLFDVAKNPARPFVVIAGSERIRAIGTRFVVRHDGERVAVTLLEGKVEVRKDGQQSPEPVAALPKPAMLTPGERLTVTPAAAVIDRPRIETVTAWRQGNVMFDDQPLGEAIAEMNRYGGPQLVLADSDLAQLRISGVFKAEDSAHFAQLAAQIHGLSVIRSEEKIELRQQ